MLTKNNTLQDKAVSAYETIFANHHFCRLINALEKRGQAYIFESMIVIYDGHIE